MDSANPTRRAALRATAATLIGCGALARASTAPAADATDRKLVVVMLRGAVDGLSVVVPHGDANYARSRDEIAIPAPGADGGARALDTLFALHPALAPLMPAWASGRLAFVHASGSPDPTRSHFDAQDHMETATPGRRATPDGWMNRLLSVLEAPRAAVRGVSLGPSMPRILTGPAQVAAMPSGAAPARPTSLPVNAALDRLYASDQATASAWTALRETRQAMAGAIGDAEGMDAGVAPGALPFAGLARDAGRLGALLRREPSLRAAFFSVGGWDTHVNQGGVRGQLSDRLGALAHGLDALARGLGERFDDTVIVVMSEFGRTVRQNGTRGTDHGHGNAIWLLGGPVRGRRVLGEWPGLETAALHEGRDLAITTDFRQVLAEVLEKHLALDDRAIAQVLPAGAGCGRRPGALRG